MSAELVEPVAALVILIGTISSVGSTLVSEVGCWSPWIRQSTWPIATKGPCWSINCPTGGTAKIGKDQLVQGLLSSTVQLRLMKEIIPDILDEALQLAIHSNERPHGSSVASSSVEKYQHSQKWTCSIVSSTAPETGPRVRQNGRGP